MTYPGDKREVQGQCSDCGCRGMQRVLGKHRDLVCAHCLGLREAFAAHGRRPAEPAGLFSGPLRAENYGNSRDWKCYRVACLELGYTLRLVRSQDEYVALQEKWSQYLRWSALALKSNKGYNVEDATAWDLAQATIGDCHPDIMTYLTEQAA